MSDGISEVYRGTYFSDKSEPEKSDIELIRSRLDILIQWHSDLAKAINILSLRLDVLEDNKSITE